jgi:predicted MPP superfamily phosphohydrolase
MRIAVFSLVFLFFMGVMNLYVYRRLVKKLHFNLDLFGLGLLWLLFALELLFVVETTTHLLVESPSLFYTLSAAVGITVILFFVTLLYDLLHTTATYLPFDQSRRRFIKIVFDSTMLVFALSYLIDGLVGGLKRPVLNQVDIDIDGFSFENFTIAQLSDLHIGPTIGGAFVRECVERVNALEPDIVVITGDLVDRSVERIEDALAPLSNLRSAHGTYFILGNHEYFHGPQSVVDYLRTLNITPLLNENVVIGSGSARFNLIGINDLVSKRFGELPYDIDKAFEGVDETIPSVVLAHQPKTVSLVRKKPYDLMLSGHTHGGQIFPFGLLVMIDQPYLSGLYSVDAKKQIFVSRGTGYWGPPVRVLAPSEISLLTLRPARKA